LPGGRRPASSHAPPQFGRRAGEYLPDGRVELAHALKAGGERDVDDRHVGGLEQQQRRLRAPGARQL
jgi:hypothetical protein